MAKAKKSKKPVETIHIKQDGVYRTDKENIIKIEKIYDNGIVKVNNISEKYRVWTPKDTIEEKIVKKIR